MWEGENLTAGGGFLLLLFLSAMFHPLQAPSAPSYPLRPPPAESTFEVIMELLANAPLQVPPAPSRSPSPIVATWDERRWESLQSLQIRPVVLLIHPFPYLSTSFTKSYTIVHTTPSIYSSTFHSYTTRNIKGSSINHCMCHFILTEPSDWWHSISYDRVTGHISHLLFGRGRCVC